MDVAFWTKVVLIFILSLGALASIVMIGKPRKPLDPGDAVLIVVVNVGMVLAIGLLL